MVAVGVGLLNRSVRSIEQDRRTKGTAVINVIVTYQVAPDLVEKNEELVRAVYEGLREIGDPDVHYATFKKADGVTFVHVASFPSAEKQAVLSNSPAFKAFQADLPARCTVPPKPEPLTAVGSYGLFG